jgi:hypothetical protein
MSDDVHTTVDHTGGMVRVEVQMSRTHDSLAGESSIDVPVTVAEVTVWDDPDTVKAVSDALREWYAEQQPTEAPEGQR